MNIKLDHMNLTVRNLDESIKWYQNLFGFEYKEGDLKHPTEPWAIVSVDDMAMCMYEDKSLVNVNEVSKTHHHRVNHFGIRVSDQVAWEQKVKENNVKVLYGGAYKYPNSLSWYLLDPSGHEIEVTYSGNEPLKY
jgi:catechol 2,3-dioxygenase-like lactoylglutathione lyase family enzyme